jgi:hypothetical protein
MKACSVTSKACAEIAADQHPPLSRTPCSRGVSLRSQCSMRNRLSFAPSARRSFGACRIPSEAGLLIPFDKQGGFNGSMQQLLRIRS